MTAYLRPTAPIAPSVLLPADPGLAMALATGLTERPLMANHHHGLWGYTGRTEDGSDVTVQASGIGGPSTVAVLRELRSHGARRVVRIGRAVPLDGGRPEGAVAVAAALAADGASLALGASTARPDAELTSRLEAALRAPAVTVVSHDLGHRAPDAERERWGAAGAVAVDLETAAALEYGAQAGLEMAAVLALQAPGAGDGDGGDEALLELGAVALTALGLAAAVG